MGCGASSAKVADQPASTPQDSKQASAGQDQPAGGNKQAPANGAVERNTKKEFKLVKVLGVGASCQVVVAINRKTKERFAMKRLKRGSPKLEHENSVLFSNETAILSSLSHPNIVSYVDSYQEPNYYNILTIMCEGGELFDRVASGSFSEQVASQLTREMLEALAYLHERKVSHRDLKPENFVFESSSVDSPMKLIDFGCAVRAEDDDRVVDVAGSPYYVAPEVLNGKFKRTGATWRASDMWSLGVIVYLLVHGYPPFNGDNQEKIFRRIELGRYQIDPRLPLSSDVQDLIKQLLVMDPEKRLTAEQALKHPWIADSNVAPDTALPPTVLASLDNFRTSCRLKKAVGRVLADRMSDKDRDELAAVFKKFDVNGDGQLGPNEIAQMMKHIGRPESDAQELLAQFDADGDGQLGLTEFAALNEAGRVGQDEDTIKATFDMFDKDGNGTVSVDEVAQLCQFLTPDAAQQVISDVDANGDGEIDFAEWLAAMGGLKDPTKRQATIQTSLATAGKTEA